MAREIVTLDRVRVASRFTDILYRAMACADLVSWKRPSPFDAIRESPSHNMMATVTQISSIRQTVGWLRQDIVGVHDRRSCSIVGGASRISHSKSWAAK